MLTLSTREVAIATVKIVFPQPTFQLLYSPLARVNMMKEGLSGSCFMVIGLCVLSRNGKAEFA